MPSYQVGYFLLRNATMFPDRTALIYDTTKISYLELNQMANKLGNHLLRRGIQKQDRVAYMFRNGAEAVIIWWATQKIGATAVPINTNLNEQEIVTMLQDAECKAFIYHENFSRYVSYFQENCDTLRVFIRRAPNSKRDDNLQYIFDSDEIEEPKVEILANDESLLLFTSGTTGRPKAVVRTQQIVREYALMMAIENGAPPSGASVITHMRLFHTGGWLNMMRMAVQAGTLVMLDNVNPEEVFSQIEKHHISQIFMMPPVMYQRLFDSGKWEKMDLSSIQDVFCSGGQCSQEYVTSIIKMFPQAVLRFSWGSTETCTPTSAVLTKEDIIKRPELVSTCGKVNANCEIKLVDESGLPVLSDHVGEALVRSPMVFHGYLNVPELNENVFDNDGWFHTEDLMKCSRDGYYFLVDRKKDMIKTGGENVYAQEVECILRMHPAILDCAVVGIPDPQYGEGVAAAIVLKDGNTLDPKEFIQFCKSKMPSYRKPRYWAFVDHLPVNSINKIQKSVLRTQANEIFVPIIDK